MISSPCKCAMDLPTQIIADHSKTLLLWIKYRYVKSFCNNESYVNGVIISDLSNHYGTLIATSAKKAEAKLPKILSISDMTKIDLDTFLNVLNKESSQLTLTHNIHAGA